MISRDRSKCSISRVITPQRATPQFTRCVTREVYLTQYRYRCRLSVPGPGTGRTEGCSGTRLLSEVRARKFTLTEACNSFRKVPSRPPFVRVARLYKTFRGYCRRYRDRYQKAHPGYMYKYACSRNETLATCASRKRPHGHTVRPHREASRGVLLFRIKPPRST